MRLRSSAPTAPTTPSARTASPAAGLTQKAVVALVLRSAVRPVLGIGLVAGLIAALGLASCRATPPADPLEREPALLIAGPAFHRLLERVSLLADTPAGRAAQRMSQRLATCDEITLALPARAADAESPSPIEALACRTPGLPAPELLAHLENARGKHAGILQWPIGDRGRIEIRVDIDERGGLSLGGRIEPDEAAGSLAFLIPSAELPAAPQIDAARTLVHLHLRSAARGGLAALVPPDSQGDRLFALRGSLLEAALLEGTLELAFVEPAAEGHVPLAVLALHHRGAAPIEAALAEALSRLEQTWSIVPSARRFNRADGKIFSGGCYADLPLLPELAPCWVVTGDALLVGYRAEAIEMALATPASNRTSGAIAATASGLVVDFDRIRTLDHRLVGGEPGPGEDDPSTSHRIAELYARLELRATAAPEGGIELDGRLEARP